MSTSEVHLTRVDEKGAVRDQEQTAATRISDDDIEITTRLHLAQSEIVWIVGSGASTGWASVSRVWPEANGTQRARLRFLPPEEANPEEHPNPEERAEREHDRLVLRLSIVLMRLGPEGEVIEKEHTVTENISPGGARVRTGMAVQVGERMALRERRGSFRAWATVCGAYCDDDGIRRLNVAFDEPLELTDDPSE